NFKERIQAGDLVYFEFGHNHKEEGGPQNYYNNIPYYYDFVRSKGAKFIVVGPIDRHRPEQYNPETNTWTPTLSAFTEMGRRFVEEQLQAGRDDIAFVDLNAPSLAWYAQLCSELGRKDTSPSFYFRSAKGDGIDRTHPNDAGVDNFAWLFIQAAKAAAASEPGSAQAEVLRGLLEGLRDERPISVPESITAFGGPPNQAYPD
ncbi:MAG: pectate lyase, partial [Limnochordia bacterium]